MRKIIEPLQQEFPNNYLCAKFIPMRLIAYCLLSIVILQSCSPNNVNEDPGLKKIFDENKVNGCFAIMDNGTGKFTVHNLSRYFDSSYLPASTFKIVNSLIGLQTGKISSDSMVIKWDSVKRWNEEWNKDLNMYQAFRVSALPYYQEVARRIGKDTMEHWLTLIGYGAKKKDEQITIKSPIDSFWLDGSLTITPDQELGLVKDLYFNQLPFFKINQEMVKRAMLFENEANYRLAYKTGWSNWNEKTKKHIGWVVGWIEENNHPYFFVLNFESPDKNFDMWNIRMKMLKEILKYLGFFEGRK
jgi:beta-lactamase class D